jgi:LmbE family N-acetylglucosaminyl deacetylase
MKAQVLVAHPDDCVIFARPFVDAHPDYEWSIVYLTYDYDDIRATEMSRYWNARNIPTKFLGFIDDYTDIENNELSFSAELAESAIKHAVDADLILTHFEDGDYGHIHHKFVNTVANKIDVPKVYFASTFNYTDEYVTTPLDLDQFPLHRTVIEGFKDRDTGRYIITRKNN